MTLDINFSQPAQHFPKTSSQHDIVSYDPTTYPYPHVNKVQDTVYRVSSQNECAPTSGGQEQICLALGPQPGACSGVVTSMPIATYESIPCESLSLDQPWSYTTSTTFMPDRTMQDTSPAVVFPVYHQGPVTNAANPSTTFPYTSPAAIAFSSAAPLLSNPETPTSTAYFLPCTSQRSPSPPPATSTTSQKSSTPPPKRYGCPICSKKFTRPSSLTTHLYSHTGEKPFKCPIEGCGRNFSVVSNLRRHAKIHYNQSF
ncbi:hypothetical protein EC973_006721 [Apophysomyces ossiformis]|uniref:C2H2-type domain-containing protein n=1 Tax=Apophysomyces ossiformis TaxID=679940 RepID=A0A8H7BYM0_9FUNG|nr:hypothetical protein EC973_006721 [Apophysomyces ossiformis]